jgi:hypothetical protein
VARRSNGTDSVAKYIPLENSNRKTGISLLPDNTIIAKSVGRGASDETARQDYLEEGPVASQRMAATDFGRVQPLIPKFVFAGQLLNLPPALLAAIASRESRCGTVLDADGWGDLGNAFGITQVDQRYHVIAGTPDPKSQAHVNQAAGTLMNIS